jgi:hypothetical protein
MRCGISCRSLSSAIIWNAHLKGTCRAEAISQASPTAGEDDIQKMNRENHRSGPAMSRARLLHESARSWSLD